MRSCFEAEPQELLAAAADAIDGLGPRSDSPLAPQLRSMIEEARRLLVDAARPRGVYQSIDHRDFESVFHGDGSNDNETALELVLENSVSLALFAVTLGGEVSEHINQLFAKDNAVTGYYLDQVASIAADQLVQNARRRYAATEDSNSGSAAVLPYSPGYCGWNVSGQQALFAVLEPADLGISLNKSCLMHPIKSVSGVLVSAPIEAHDFNPTFPCCAVCTTFACRDRIESIRKEQATSRV